MDRGYAAYCLADRHFYDSPVRAIDSVDYAVARRPLPPGWQRSAAADWLVCRPERIRLPAQGWKIHVSARLDEAADVLATVWDYCTAQPLAFKFIRSRLLYLLRNAKQADRASSGKLVTIYPADEGELERTLFELAGRLQGRRGPYILSDLRWGDGPLYVRYGGFAERRCRAADGSLVPAIEDGEGRLVPDVRAPVFQTPPWVTMPACLRPHLAARGGATIDEMPYRIEAALHFSNAGGLYRAVDRKTGARVALKEARPHAGLSGDGLDAVARLERERWALDRLAGLECVPALHGTFTFQEHRFLAVDFVEAKTLTALLVERYPLTAEAAGCEAAAEHARWALEVCRSVEAAVAAIHERDVVIGDLQPSNVLVRPDGSIVVIDFEVATAASEPRRPTLATRGFAAPSAISGFAVDRYALACLRLFAFLPLTTLIALDAGKAAELADEIGTLFPVPKEFLDEAVAAIAAAHELSPASVERPGDVWRTLVEAGPEGWRQARDSLARGIAGSATPDRHDRLFPGDVRQFERGGGLNLAYGAAGVLYALDAVGIAVDGAHERWLVERALAAARGAPLGLYDGLCGIAYVLDRLGRRGDALDLLAEALDRLDPFSPEVGDDLFAGLAGIGLTVDHFARATGDASLGTRASQITERLADRFGVGADPPGDRAVARTAAGLLRGSSGAALFFLRRYEQSGDEALLDLATRALRDDLGRCVSSRDGRLHVDEGWRTMPYLGDGSIGIGMVLDQHRRHRHEDDLAAAATSIHDVATTAFTMEPGLFSGRAGMILHARRGLPPGPADAERELGVELRRLARHAILWRGHLSFPGHQLLRLSMDLASGAAGILLAVAGVTGDPRAHLPFLEPLDLGPGTR